MPEINVQDEQGNIHVFPDGSTPEMIAQALGVKPPTPVVSPQTLATARANIAKYPENTASIGPAAKPWSVPWLKSKFYTAADAMSEGLPAAGATAGALIGGTAGTAAPGAGNALGAVGGAGIGGMAGDAAKQLVRRWLGFSAPETSTDAANEISREGLTQGGIEAATAGLARFAPWLRNAAASQYERALAPTTRANKAIVEDITPQMIKRGIHGSLEGIEQQAGEQATNLRPQLDQAYANLTAKTARPPVRGLLPAAPTDIPLANPPANALAQSAGGVYPAARPQIPESAFSPEARIAAGDSGLSPIRLTDPASPDAPYRYYATSARTPVAEIPETSAGGVLRTRNPEIANQFESVPRGAYPNLPRSSIQGSGTQILSDLERLKGRYIVNGQAANPQAVNAISGVQDIVRQYGNDISPNSLRQLKQIFDEPVAARGGYAGADLTTQYTVKAQKAAGNSIRNILHQASPDVAALDKEISFWLDVQRVAGASALRRTGQEGLMRGLGLPFLSAVTGGAVGHVAGAHTVEGAATAALSVAAAQAIRSPAWRTASAVFKDRFADALASGNVGQVAGLAGRLGVTIQGYQPANSPANRSGQPQ